MLLEERTLGLGLSRCIVDREAKQPNQSLRLGSGDTVSTARSLISLEYGLVGSVEDEDRLDWGGEEAGKSIEEGSNGGVGST